MISFIQLFPPEIAHFIALKSLHFLYHIYPRQKKYVSPVTVMGLNFLNPLGLAAGIDKNADYIDALGALGFGFIEVGTVTPHAQIGNKKPRLFRYPKQRALVNHMGFNNRGVDYVVRKLKRKKYTGIIGVNIGKNFFTPLVHAAADYIFCFKKLAPWADYITINISSPNTENLRELQQAEWLDDLLKKLKNEQTLFFLRTKKYVPLVVKIAPDLSIIQIKVMADIFLKNKIDGIIATNTTIEFSEISNEVGGLSGEPLRQKSTFVLTEFKKILHDHIPLIGCGGIFSLSDAKEKVQAGAALIQIYTGLIYQGPKIIKTLLTTEK